MYQFKKINDDEYKLISGDKEFTFTRTVDVVRKLQSIDMVATVKVVDILAERGETYENTKLRIERKEGNQTIVDESNLRRIETEARKQASIEVVSDLIEKIFGRKLTDLILELGMVDEKDGENFITDIMNILLNGLPEDTPRGEN